MEHEYSDRQAQCEAPSVAVDRESLLRGILDNSGAAIFVCDHEACLQSVNKAYERIVGLDAAQILGRRVHELYQPQDADWMLAVVQEVYHGALARTYEASFSINGEVRTFICSLFPLHSKVGVVTSVCGIVTEITERKRFESQLRIAHRALLVLGEANRAVIYACEEHSLAQEVCRLIVQEGGYRLAWAGLAGSVDSEPPELEAHFGLRQALQQAGGDAGHHEVAALLRELNNAFLRSRMAACFKRRGQPWIVRHIHGDASCSSVRPLAARLGFSSAIAIPLDYGQKAVGVLHICAPEPDAFHASEVELLVKLTGNLAHGIHSLRLEEQRRDAEAALQASEARYRAVVEDQTEVISRFKADGSFTFVNDVYCRVFGKPREELLKGAWQPVCLEEDLPRVEEALVSLSPDNPVVQVENRVIDGQGQVVWMQFVNRGFFDQQGRLQEVQSVGRDITRQKTLQAETIRSARLASLGELAAGVAHEVNNPLTGIINCAQLLVDQMRHTGHDAHYADYAHHAHYAEIILKEGRRVAHIVRSLLSLAREDQGQPERQKATEALLLALDLVRAQMEKAGVVFSLDLQPELPELMASKARLQQVFLNLLRNAHQAMKRLPPGDRRGKHMRICVAACRRDNRPMLEYRLEDSGEGLGIEDVSRLFDPFFSTKPHGEGTGLGLSISRSIVEYFGGRMELQPNEYGGATAVVWLPALQGENT